MNKLFKSGILIRRQSYSSKTTSFDKPEDLRVKIGLEIHARILSKTKIFSDAYCYDMSNSLPNSNVTHFDLAVPGTMPTLNKRCIQAGLISALALKCSINGESRFERKHYFYADLPAGYQITQQRKPIAFNGTFKFPIINPKTHKLTYKECRIRQLQLEHDSARSLKTESLSLKLNDSLPQDFTLIDHNRTGLGLMEIVTEPDFETAFESYSFVRELALTLKSLDTCNANMSNGEFRVDVNVSCHKLDSQGNISPGVRVELKNLNSFSSVLKATEIEIKRQKSLISSGKSVKRETRTYDSTNNKTVAIRTKEDKYDYRFMPEPNLLPLIVYPSQSFKPTNNSMKCANNSELVFDSSYLKRINADFVCLDLVKSEFKSKILPQQRRAAIKEKYGLTDEICFIFTANDLDRILDRVMEKRKDLNKNELVRVLLNEYLNQVNTNVNLEDFNFELKCDKIASYVELTSRKLISKRINYKFFTQLFAPDDNMNKLAFDLAKEKNLFLINDSSLINETVLKLLSANPKAISDYKQKLNKRAKVFDFFVGRVHKELNDLADQDLVDKIVKENLENLLK